MSQPIERSRPKRNGTARRGAAESAFLLLVWLVSGLIVLGSCSSSNKGPAGEDGGPAVCGNGAREEGETCDGEDLGGESCESLGYERGGVLACDDSCHFDGSQCEGTGRCGNGIKDEGEECDGPDLGELSCWSRAGLMDGTLTCAQDCTADTSACHTCGDRVLQGPEECDGINLDGRSCRDLGFQGGTLACDEDCLYDTSGCSTSPAGWYDDAWAYRLPLKIEYLRVQNDLTDFPLAVVLTGLDLGTKIQPLGQDILFTSGDGQTKLPHELERVNPARGEVVAWVRLDHVSATEHTTFYMYYGNPECASQQNSTQVWENGFLGVWHLGELTTDGDLGATHTDSTVHGHHGVQYGNETSHGVVGAGQFFDGGGDYVELSAPDALPLGNTDCTVSAWIRTSEPNAMGLLIKSANGFSEPGAKLIGLGHTPSKLGVDHAGAAYLASTVSVADDAWHHIAWTQTKDATGEAEGWRIYIDGELDTAASVETLDDVAGHTLHLGGLVAESKFPTRFHGRIDEVRISSVARPDTWLKAHYHNQKDATGFVTAGVEQPLQ